jgi:geranylgeranyl reductase family protein
MRYDVIVAGAGPAGSTTARECAARGLSVLLLEKDAFPRDKPCGGGVTIRAARLLPFDLSPVVERTVHGMRFSVRQAGAFTRAAGHPLTYMTQRSRLDAYLAQQAVAAGAVLRERAPVRAVDRVGHDVLVRAGTASFRGRALIAADGANGPTARLAGVPMRFRQGVALEGNVTPAGDLPEDWQDVLGLDLGDVPGGYGWLFPKGDHVNIGVATMRSSARTLRPRLSRLTRSYGYDPSGLWGVRGFYLPVRTPWTPVTHGSILLVGDAAGLLDPLTGEGIYAAIWSGQVAARHLLEWLSGMAPDLSGYEREVRTGLIPELEVAWRWYDFAHLSPAAFARLIDRSPRAWNLICRILRGEETYVGFTRRRAGIAVLVGGVSWLARLGRLYDVRGS